MDFLECALAYFEAVVHLLTLEITFKVSNPNLILCTSSNFALI